MRRGYSTQRLLAEDLGIALSTLSNFLTGKPVDLAVFEEICRKLSLEPQQIAEQQAQPAPQPAPVQPLVQPSALPPDSQHDWGEAPDVSVFYDRVSELTTLEGWIRQDRCRLIAILGMGGMGKTAFSMKLAERTQDEFELVIWRSLRNAPPVLDLLVNLIQFLSGQQEIDLPNSIDGCILRLIHYLRTRRALLILDNAESVLQAGERSGQYQPGYEGYGQILRAVGDSAHQSCLILTSREKPTGLAHREGKSAPVRSLQLAGLSALSGQAVVKQQGTLAGTESEWQMLVQHYAGNPLALKMVASGVEDFFGGEIAKFLQYASLGSLVFDNIRDLLMRQVGRLSELELEVMNWLAINREPVTPAELQVDLGLAGLSELLAALASLQRRSLIESGAAGFSQQPVVMEFVTEQLLLHVYRELTDVETPLSESLLRRYALVKATAKDYIRESQIRLILEPLITLSLERLGAPQMLEERLRGLLNQFHQSQIPARYAVGNMLHLLRQLNADLTGLNLSGLQIWQANFSNLTLHQVNLSQAQIARSVFAETFGSVLSVAFSPDGKWLAAGESNGSIQIWEIANSRKLMTLHHHTSWVWSVVFAPHPHDPEQQILVSVSDDYQVKLWDLQTGSLLRTLLGHQRSVNALALSPDMRWIATGSQDATIRLWDLQQLDQPPRILAGHSQRVWSVAFSPTGQMFASASEDHTVKLWNLASGECYQTLHKDSNSNGIVAFSPDGSLLASGGSEYTIWIWQLKSASPSEPLPRLDAANLQVLRGHTDTQTALRFSPDGRYLASSSYDHTAKLWDIATGECIKTFTGHKNRLWSVAFSPAGTLLASGGDDRAIKLWDLQSGQCTMTLQGHTNAVLSLALSENLLVSGHEDEAIRIWHPQTGKLHQTLHGHCDRVWSVGFVPDTVLQSLGLEPSAAETQQIIVSGSADRTIKLWDWRRGNCLKTLQGHKSWVWSVVCSPCGRYLASSSYDRTIKLWDLATGDCLDSWKAQRSDVALVLSPDGEVLASAGFDGCIRLWNVQTRQLIRQLEAHTDSVWQVVFSADGQQLASASYDQTLRLWDIASGQCLRTFVGHTAPVLAVAFSGAGRLISSGFDQTVRVWDLQTGQCLQIMQGHTGHIPALASASHATVFSGSFDETIKLWNINTGKLLKSFQSPRPYEQMNIIDTVGLTDAERESLKALGAIEL